jgi:RimJ/RimL family protein N-acetyltransferase
MNVIETERLLLEPLSEERREAFVALTGDPEVMRYWGTGGPYARDDALRHFAASLGYWAERGFGKRSVIAKGTGDWLGFVDTTRLGPGCGDLSPDEVEIGWMLKRSVWGRGYATEAARAARDDAFERVGLQSVIALYHPENGASGRIIEKLGMAFERDVVGWGGEPLRVHRLTREQWERLR